MIKFSLCPQGKIFEPMISLFHNKKKNNNVKLVKRHILAFLNFEATVISFSLILFCIIKLYYWIEKNSNFFQFFHSKKTSIYQTNLKDCEKQCINVNRPIMLPPRNPHSSNVLSSERSPNNKNQHQNNFHNNRQGSSSLDSRSRVSKYEHLRTTEDKRKALGKRRYINQLAYLDYEDKEIEIHTKYTMVSKATAMKKIKAKNLLADFVDEEQEIEFGFEELMDYKYGKQSQNGNNFYFEKAELTNEYVFCCLCDTIHNDHHEVHEKICREKINFSHEVEEYDKSSPLYVSYSLRRIETALKKTAGQEYDDIKLIVKRLFKLEQNPAITEINNNNNKLETTRMDLEKCLKQMNEIKKVNDADNVLQGIINKILKLYNRNRR